MEKEDSFQTIDLLELFAVMWSKLGYILLAGIFCAACVFFYTKLVIPYQYTSSVSLYVTNTTYNTGVSDSVNISDVNASQQLVNTYRIILQDEVVMDEISQRLNEEYTVDELLPFMPYDVYDEGVYMPSTEAIKKCISYSSVEETEIMEINVTTGNPKLSADILNYVVDIAPDTIIRVIGAGSVEPIGKVKITDEPSGPNVKKNTAIGLIFGIVIAAGIVFLRYFLDNTITGGDDLKLRFDLPVLGEIPFYELVGKEDSTGDKKDA